MQGGFASSSWCCFGVSVFTPSSPVSLSGGAPVSELRLFGEGKRSPTRRACKGGRCVGGTAGVGRSFQSGNGRRGPRKKWPKATARSPPFLHSGFFSFASPRRESNLNPASFPFALSATRVKLKPGFFSLCPLRDPSQTQTRLLFPLPSPRRESNSNPASFPFALSATRVKLKPGFFSLCPLRDASQTQTLLAIVHRSKLQLAFLFLMRRLNRT
jgi:hypothetical protein